MPFPNLFRFKCSLCGPFTLLMMGLLVSFGCSKKEHPAKRSELRLAISEEPTRLDPRRASNHISGQVLDLCHEQLVYVDDRGVAHPRLAEAFSVSEDGLTYTFTIRSDAKWSNGDPIKAADFEYAWKSTLDPQFLHAGYAHMLYKIKHAEAIKRGKLPIDALGVQTRGERVLIVELERPTPHFLEIASGFTYAPVNQRVAEKNLKWAEAGGENYVCSGPFELTAWQHQYALKFEKNPHYWNADNIKIDTIDLSIVQDANTCLNLFENGEIDLMGRNPLGELPAEAMTNLIQNGSLKSAPMASSLWLVLKIDDPLLSNLNIRKALTLAINRETIAQNALPGMFKANTHLLPSALRRDQSAKFADGDIALAQKHFSLGLEESGLTRDEFNSLTLVTDTGAANQKIVQAIQQQWSDALGIQVKLQQFERKTHIRQMADGKFQIGRNQWNSELFDASNILELFAHKDLNNNFPRWENSEYTALCEKAGVELDRSKRQALMERAESILLAELPVIPLFEFRGNLLINPKLKGVQLQVVGPMDFRNAHFEN